MHPAPLLSSAGAGLRGALRYEWRRITTVRSTYLLVALSLVGSGLVAWGSGVDVDREQQAYALAVATSPAALPALLLGILGVFAFGHEYRFGMIRPTLTALPRRSHVAAAKVAVVLAWAAVTWLASAAVAVAVVGIVAQNTEYVSLTGGHTGRMLLGSFLYTMLFALAGLALGLLFRNVPAATGVLVIVPLVVENVIAGLLSIKALHAVRRVGDFLPFRAGSRMYEWRSSVPSGDFGSHLSPLAGGLTMACFVAVVLAVAWLLLQRRDA